MVFVKRGYQQPEPLKGMCMKLVAAVLTLTFIAGIGFAQGIERVANTAASGADFARDQLWNTQFGALRAENAGLKIQTQVLQGQVAQLLQYIGASTTLVVSGTTTSVSVTSGGVTTTLTSATVPVTTYPRCQPGEMVTANGSALACQRLTLNMPTCAAGQYLTSNGVALSCVALPTASEAPSNPCGNDANNPHVFIGGICHPLRPPPPPDRNWGN